MHVRAHRLLSQDSRRCLLSAVCRAKAEREGRGGGATGGFWEVVQRALYCSHGDFKRRITNPTPPPFLPNGEGGHLAEVAFVRNGLAGKHCFGRRGVAEGKQIASHLFPLFGFSLSCAFTLATRGLLHLLLVTLMCLSNYRGTSKHLLNQQNMPPAAPPSLCCQHPPWPPLFFLGFDFLLRPFAPPCLCFLPLELKVSPRLGSEERCVGMCFCARVCASLSAIFGSLQNQRKKKNEGEKKNMRQEKKVK